MELLKALAEDPAEIFKLAKQEDAVEKFNSVTKILLDRIAPEHSVLDEIYVDGLDASQVFGQAQMVLLGVGENLLFEKIPELREKYGNQDEEDEENDNENGSDVSENEEEFFLMESGDEQPAEAESGEDANQSDENGAQFELEEEEGTEAEDEEAQDVSDAESEETKVAEDDQVQPTKDAFGLNDGFFDIDAFNKQIIALEDENLDDNDEEIDLFADLSDEDNSEGEEMEYYDEFFDKPGVNKFSSTGTTKSKAPKQDSDNEEDEDEDVDAELGEKEYDQAVESAVLDLFADEEEDQPKDTKHLSSYEKQQQQLQAEIAKLEAELVAEKKWTMKGEVRSKDRPTDSLLDDEEAPSLEFDRTSKPVPVITEEVTETIEDLIKRRVRNDEFDDLPKRLITDVSRFVQKQKTEVSDQKSGKSLAEIYEDEYHGVDPEQKISEEVQQAHDEISDLFTSLNYKLDSLCLAHYIPKPHEFKTIDIKVSDGAAAISMEDAQPLHVSDESKLAPQEVYKIGDDKEKADGARGVSQVVLKSGLAYSKDELSRDDKQRLRRAKKRAKSKHFNELKEVREQREKQQPQQGNDRKRQKVGEVMDTLSKAKNVTVIDKKGQLRDALGKLKKADGPQTGSRFRL